LRGTEVDLAGAYNSAFVSWKRVGARTSLIVDPPNGRIPPLTPEAQKIAAAEREYRLALLQATEACKTMPSRAVSKETLASRGCSMDDARKISHLRWGEVPIRQPGIA
jgi:hypothetical protein